MYSLESFFTLITITQLSAVRIVGDLTESISVAETDVVEYCMFKSVNPI